MKKCILLSRASLAVLFDFFLRSAEAKLLALNLLGALNVIRRSSCVFVLLRVKGRLLRNVSSPVR